MSELELKYDIDDTPPVLENLIFGLQWLAITMATVIIIREVVAGLHFDDFAGQLVYMQKLFFVMSMSLFFQVFLGHRLPLITGPATVLLVGIVAGGLMVTFGTGGFSFQDGLIISIPSMISIIVSYLPGTVKAARPPLLMPVVGNGFVIRNYNT